MEPITLDENKTLNYFLNDEDIFGGGIYLASALEKFVSWQNDFINELIDKKKKGRNSNGFISKINQNINVNEVTEKEILNFEKVCNYLKENIKQITKMENRQFIFDFDLMEKAIENYIEIKKFSGDNMKFITYGLEGFRNKKSNIMEKFIYLYKNYDLINQKKQKIIKEIKNDNNYLEKMLSSLQSLIYYLTNNIKSSKDKINSILDAAPENLNISDESIQFFRKHDFKICQLESLYSLFEFFSFDIIKNNLIGCHIFKINKNISKFFNRDMKYQIQYLNKTNLSTAIRKLISRYFVGGSFGEINKDEDLSSYLLKEELQSENDWKNKSLITKDLEILKKNKIKVGHSYELYQLLGGDKEEILKEINSKDNESEEEEELEEAEDNEYRDES